MRTNGGGADNNRAAEQHAMERLGPLARAAIMNAPFNFGAGSAARMLGRYDDAEIALCVNEFIQSYMRGGDSESTRAHWGRLKGQHPQLAPDYPNKEYQLYPLRKTKQRAMSAMQLRCIRKQMRNTRVVNMQQGS